MLIVPTLLSKINPHVSVIVLNNLSLFIPDFVSYNGALNYLFDQMNASSSRMIACK